MLGSPCNACCSFCGCDIAPSQVLMTSPATRVAADLVAAFVTTGRPQDFNTQLKLAIYQISFLHGGPMQFVAVRDDSVAPYGGYGFKYADTTPDLAGAFSFDVTAGGGGFFAGGFQQGFVSKPGVVATLNVVRVGIGGVLFGYFIENNPSHPQSDRNGKPYCMKFGGSMSVSYAIYDTASGYTYQTTPDIATISFTIADTNLREGFSSYPALYRSSQVIQVAPGVGFTQDRRTFPSPYLCIPDNSFSVSASLFTRQYSRSYTNDEQPGVIDLAFSGNGIRSASSGGPAVGP